MKNRGLSLKTKVGFAVCDIGGELFFAATGFWLLNYLTDTVGLAAGLAGVVIAVGKIWDAITDPIMGHVSDRTSSRWGRRRPYILFGSLPLFIAMILMFTNPGLKSQASLFVWGTVVFCFLCTAFTVVNIPYNSLTPELTQDYHERSALNGYRFAFGIVGTLIGAGAALPIINSLPNRDIGFTVMGTVFGSIMFVTALITFFSLREPETRRKKPTDGFFRTYLTVFKNKPYVLILTAYTMNLTFITIIMGVAVYYFKYILNQEAKTTIGMLILLITAMVFIPVSVLFSKKVGKKLVYGLGIGIYIVGLMLLFLLGHRYGVNYSFAVLALIGIGQGFAMAMPYAIVADAVEYDYLLTGKRREGAFYGVWTFSTKVGIAIGLGISGLVLSLTGYIPDVIQTETARLGIRLLMGPIPATICVLAIVFLWLYPITEKRYNEILEKIGEMERGKMTNTP
jgi:GPH family glycoside/pentoside/hexuronide:cation symporter